MIRYLLTLGLVLLAAPCFAVLTRTYTICEGGGCDYTTLQSAETAIQQDLVANDSIITFEIQNTWATPDGIFAVNGWTTDVTRFPTITAVGAARSAAIWNTSAYISKGGTSTFVISEDFVVVDGIQVEMTETGPGGANGIIVSGTGTGSQTIKNCFVKGAGGAGNRGIGIIDISVSGAVIRNCIVIDCGDVGFEVATLNNGATLDNNTAENCNKGFETSADDGILRNSIMFNCTTPAAGSWSTTTLSEENWTDNASISYGGCGSCGDGDQFSQPDPFVSLGDENYHLASGATAIDAGKDLSADFTDDIDGDIRPQGSGFDKGADEFVSAGPTKKLRKGKYRGIKL